MSDPNNTVFISHAHEDRALAEAWQTLLKAISADQIDPWYSSDPRVKDDSGIVGNWRDKIREKINTANTVLVIVTPGSNARPWIVWESGFAAGKAKNVIPIVYYFKPSHIHSVFSAERVFEGEVNASIKKLCGVIVNEVLDNEVSQSTASSWSGPLENYLTAISKQRETSLSRRLFHKHFHVQDTADRLEGDWHAKWVQLHDDGTVEPFEQDSLHIWSTEDRVRIVGFNTKVGIDQVEGAKYYPMEGVVSRSGWIALSYWSAGNIPVCGTCLLKPVGSTGRIYEGSWSGYTARDLSEEATLVHGKIIMARDVKVVEDY